VSTVVVYGKSNPLSYKERPKIYNATQQVVKFLDLQFVSDLRQVGGLLLYLFNALQKRENALSYIVREIQLFRHSLTISF
jgi:hypothetical protein